MGFYSEKGNFNYLFSEGHKKGGKMKGLAIIIFCGILLSACGSSPALIPTLTSKPTQTPDPTPTSTPRPTPTFTPQPTPTVPVDTRIVDDEPKKFILTKLDLPKSADYIIPNSGWSSPYSNTEVSIELGGEEGKKFLSDSGRVTGWEEGFRRRSKSVGETYPYELELLTHQFKTVDGAKYLMDQVIAEQGYHEFDFPSGDPSLIDESTFEGGKFTYFAGHTVDSLSLAVQHRNMVVILDLFGFEGTGEVTQEFAIEMMNKIISKIDKAELHQEWVE
jgi:hypothetical protein